MSATFETVPRLLEHKFPDCVFNSLPGHDNTAKPVLKACPIIVDSQPSSSEIEAMTAVPAQPSQTAAQDTITTNGQATSSTGGGRTSSGDRSIGTISSDTVSASHEPAAQLDSPSDQATRPTKPLLENFRSLKELVSVFKDYVEVIRDLYNAGILHHDISPGNLITVEDECESVRKGYIIDFDCAIFIPHMQSAKAERTGTLPFMAIDILMDKNTPHMYHYDLESLFYVLLWICITQDGPKSKHRSSSEFNFKDSPLHFWRREGDSELLMQAGKSKISDMWTVKQFKQQILPWLSAYFRPLESIFLSLRRILFRNPDTDDIESLPEDQKPISDRRDISGVFRKLIEVFEATLKGLPDEQQPSAVFDEQITGQSGDDARHGCNVADFVAAKIPELIELRPLERLPAEPRKTGVGCETGLHITAVMNSADNGIGPRGVKRSHDEEQITEAVPHPSSSKRARCQMNDG